MDSTCTRFLHTSLLELSKRKNEKRVRPGVNKEFALKSVLRNIITFPAMLSSMIKGKKDYYLFSIT